jgi:hypothetical protein
MKKIRCIIRNALVLEQLHATSIPVLYEQDLLDPLHLIMKRDVPESHEDYQLAAGKSSAQLPSAANNCATWSNDPRMASCFNIKKFSAALLRQHVTMSFARSYKDGSKCFHLGQRVVHRYITSRIGKSLRGFLTSDVSSLDANASFSTLALTRISPLSRRVGRSSGWAAKPMILSVMCLESVLLLSRKLF